MNDCVRIGNVDAKRCEKASLCCVAKNPSNPMHAVTVWFWPVLKWMEINCFWLQQEDFIACATCVIENAKSNDNLNFCIGPWTHCHFDVDLRKSSVNTNWINFLDGTSDIHMCTLKRCIQRFWFQSCLFSFFACLVSDVKTFLVTCLKFTKTTNRNRFEWQKHLYNVENETNVESLQARSFPFSLELSSLLSIDFGPAVNTPNRGWRRKHLFCLLLFRTSFHSRDL